MKRTISVPMTNDKPSSLTGPGSLSRGFEVSRDEDELSPRSHLVSRSSSQDEPGPRLVTVDDGGQQPRPHRPRTVTSAVEERLVLDRGRDVGRSFVPEFRSRPSDAEAKDRLEDVAMEEALKMERLLMEQSSLLHLVCYDQRHRMNDERFPDRPQLRHEEPGVSLR